MKTKLPSFAKVDKQAQFIAGKLEKAILFCDGTCGIPDCKGHITYKYGGVIAQQRKLNGK